MEFTIGEKRRLIRPQIDDDENGHERTTPVGAIVVIEHLEPNGEYFVGCPDTGGNWFMSVADIAVDTVPFDGKLASYHFDLGNSSDGPIGCCARVSAHSAAAAVKMLKSFLEQHADIEVRGTRNEATEGVEYLTVYLNADAVTEAAIDDWETLN